MNNRIIKKSISIILVLVLIFSMSATTLTSFAATKDDISSVSGIGGALVEKLLERGKRVTCTLSLKLNEAVYGEVDEGAESFCKWFLMDAAEATAYETKKLCEEILKEITVLEGKITDYTVKISEQIAGTVASDKHALFTQRWEKDVTDVISKNNMKNVYDSYCKFFIIGQLKESGLPTDAEQKKNLDSIWKSLTGKDSITQNDITDAAYNAVEKEFKTALFHIYNPNASVDNTDAIEAVYKNTTVNDAFVNVINQLTDNFVYSGGGTIQSQQSCVEAAATYAYFALPFSHEQHDFISCIADKQVMTALIFQMAYNEFLAYQGEYLESNGLAFDKPHISSGNLSIPYNQLRQYYLELTESIADDASTLYGSDITIDIEAYDAKTKTITRKLSSYMPKKDATVVAFTPDTYYESYDYTDFVERCGFKTSVIVNGTHETKPKYINKPIDFCRVMSGGSEQTVYYILDSSKLSNEGNSIGMIDHCIDRQADIVNYYGNLHVESADYKNLASSYNDGGNWYWLPRYSEVKATDGGVLKDLFATPTFAFADYTPDAFLGDYAPAKKSGESYILTSSTGFSHTDKEIYPSYAFIYLVNASSGNNKSEITSGEYSFEDLKFNNGGYNHSQITILVNHNDEDIYMQEAKLKLSDPKNTVEDFYIVNNGDALDESKSELESAIATLTAPGKIKSGNNIALRFKLNNDETFESLKMIRKNAQVSEITLINSYDELAYFEKADDGYYEFNYNMPYSQVDFVLKTKKALDKDKNENFIIKSYDDLLIMRDNVESSIEDYVNGSYVLTNDITCPSDANWTTPIGTSNSPFCGTFDGQGHTINGLTIKEAYDTDIGLFGNLKGATIKNTHLKDVDIDFETDSYSPAFDGPDSTVGAFCGTAYAESVFSNCTVSGTVKVKGALNVGGISGYALDTVIEKCINYCNITSDSKYLGGILGLSNYGVELNNCANLGSVTADDSLYCGGITGGGFSGDYHIYNSYNVGRISGTMSSLYEGTYYIGAFGGNKPSVDNCYALDNNPELTVQGNTVTAGQFKSGEVAYLLNNGVTDGTQVWYQNIDFKEPYDEYPHFNKVDNNTVYKENNTYTNEEPVTIEKNEDGVFVIENYKQLRVLAKNVNAGLNEYADGNYILANDITVPENEYWNTPIGTSSSKFTGSFDGQGHKIIGLKSNMPAQYDPSATVVLSNIGLFGWVENVDIKNICLENVNFNINSEYYIAYAGALCARADGDNTFSKCIASGSMNFEASTVGGLVGCAPGENTFTNCANLIDITTSYSTECGGIVGNCGFSSTVITNCYNVGEFSGSIRNCTVITGSGGKINNCYALDNNDFVTYSGTTVCTAEQFKSGEVAHMLNNNDRIVKWAWFQNIDNGKTPDSFPTLTCTIDNLVFKVNEGDKSYSNTPDNLLRGDTDLDGHITIIDATRIQIHCAKINELTGVALANADTVKDYVISITDATKIQAYIASIIKEL